MYMAMWEIKPLQHRWVWEKILLKFDKRAFEAEVKMVPKPSVCPATGLKDGIVYAKTDIFPT